MPHPTISLGQFTFNPGSRTLHGRNGATRLSPRAAGVLEHLSDCAGEAVSRDALLDAVWPDVIVTDDSLTQAIGEIRRALGCEARGLVETVPKFGYRLAIDSARQQEVQTDPFRCGTGTDQFDLHAYRCCLESSDWIARGGRNFLARSEAAARYAAKRAPAFHVARAQYAISLCYRWLYQRESGTDPALALAEAEAAVRLRPDRGIGHAAKCFALGALGRHSQARVELERGFAVDPNSEELLFLGVRSLFAAQDYRTAAALAERLACLAPANYLTAFLAARAASAFDFVREQRNARECLKRLRARLEIDPLELRALNLLGPVQAMLGNEDESQIAIERQPDRTTTLRIYDAVALARVGDCSQSQALLESLPTTGWRHAAWLAAEPAFAPMREDRRFRDLVGALAAG